ncbi:MAG: hypothetical protein H2069_02695 [Legionella sp.]|nr:hypothetical protein [Legionella sp.]
MRPSLKELVTHLNTIQKPLSNLKRIKFAEFVLGEVIAELQSYQKNQALKELQANFENFAKTIEKIDVAITQQTTLVEDSKKWAIEEKEARIALYELKKICWKNYTANPTAMFFSRINQGVSAENLEDREEHLLTIYQQERVLAATKVEIARSLQIKMQTLSRLKRCRDEVIGARTYARLQLICSEEICWRNMQKILTTLEAANQSKEINKYSLEEQTIIVEAWNVFKDVLNNSINPYPDDLPSANIDVYNILNELYGRQSDNLVSSPTKNY